ncbi:DUF4240 domain-containing protein [Streptomyces sp. NPDC006482]|uniref:DUF4240 domain-containing protein n=1 Tax=unclassified Streptomyces TaxID=2593676 RepID=UPI0022516DFA|nr:DUF4240 domain-containing protein [Streptomyces sp. NBC_00094]MCX5393154.1 DUF4240 domain-containing protein [Streptomyces sp. NBC_00094]
MNEDAFWALIDELSRRPGDRDERLEWLRAELTRRPETESVAFQVRLEAACDAAATRAVWSAANRVEGGDCTDDGLHYFTLWLVGQGRKVYDSVVADPDALADVAGIRALVGRHRDEWADCEWPEWEELDYVAQDVFDELTGQEDDEGEAFLDAVEEAEEELADELDDEFGEGRGEEFAEEWEEGGELQGARPEGVALPRLTALFPLGPSGS